ncbi:MAG: 50S ribosomal protein L23 [Epsilonproteobacteria bacterium]|nr:50S ribosomal protein L23 [Campylobacterota bacterium]
MELSIYSIIKKPVITSKAVELFRKYGRVTFEVHREANKPMIRAAVEKIWNVKVEQINVSNKTGKTKSFARRTYKKPDQKRAIITLKEGYKIEIPGLVDTVKAAEETQAQMKKTDQESE